jgi:hypothetical protein
MTSGAMPAYAPMAGRSADSRWSTARWSGGSLQAMISTSSPAWIACTLAAMRVPARLPSPTATATLTGTRASTRATAHAHPPDAPGQHLRHGQVHDRGLAALVPEINDLEVAADLVPELGPEHAGTHLDLLVHRVRGLARGRSGAGERAACADAATHAHGLAIGEHGQLAEITQGQEVPDPGRAPPRAPQAALPPLPHERRHQAHAESDQEPDLGHEVAKPGQEQAHQPGRDGSQGPEQEHGDVEAAGAPGLGAVADAAAPQCDVDAVDAVDTILDGRALGHETTLPLGPDTGNAVAVCRCRRSGGAAGRRVAACVSTARAA